MSDPTGIVRRGIFGEPLPALYGAVAMDPRHERLTIATERIGWEVTSLEIDAERGTARVWAQAMQSDLRVMLDLRGGKATIERFRRRLYTETIGRRGDRCRVDRIADDFLGRFSFTDQREALREFVEYLVANGTAPSLPAPGIAAILVATTGGAP